MEFDWLKVDCCVVPLCAIFVADSGRTIKLSRAMLLNCAQVELASISTTLRAIIAGVCNGHHCSMRLEHLF